MIYSSFTALICTLVYRQHNGNKSKLLVSNHIYISLMLVTHQQRSMCTRINSIISYAQKHIYLSKYIIIGEKVRFGPIVY